MAGIFNRYIFNSDVFNTGYKDVGVQVGSGGKKKHHKVKVKKIRQADEEVVMLIANIFIRVID